MTDTTVPIFSLAELTSGARADELHDCLTRKGVFYLSDYGATEADHQLVSKTAVDFFLNGTAEQKKEVTPQDETSRRGYSQLGAESTAIVTNTGKYSDYSMCFSMGLTGNLFPDPHFEEIWTLYFNRLYGISKGVARAVLGNAGNFTGNVEEFLDCEPLLRLRYFPEVPENRTAEKQPLRMAPHYDISIITLIHQTPCANGFVSLQVDIDGQLVDLPANPEAIVVLCGAVARLATEGRIHTPKHHVGAPPADRRVGSSRTSSVFFMRPKPDYPISVPLAKQVGFDVSLTGETATFAEWIGGNYVNMRKTADLS